MRTLPVLPELPPMRCDADCRGCCSEAVPVTEPELVRVVLYANERGIEPQESDPRMCPWYQGGRCAVHEVRPLICHAFGHHPALDCERGYNANVSDVAPLEAALRELGPPTRFLHEVRRTGTAEVCEAVWDRVQANRQRAGLPPLAGKAIEP
jgi:putative zinc- or iron-chelating protein